LDDEAAGARVTYQPLPRNPARRVIEWYRIRNSANPVEISRLGIASSVAALFLLGTSALGVQPRLTYVLARIALIGLIVEGVRVARRPRQPLPDGAEPLVRWTIKRAIFALALVVVAILAALIAIGYAFPD
jgi:hypothetical protein